MKYIIILALLMPLTCSWAQTKRRLANDSINQQETVLLNGLALKHGINYDLTSFPCGVGQAANNGGTEIDSLLSVSESFERMMNRTEAWNENCHSDIFSLLNEVSFEEGKRLQIDLSEKEVFRGEFRIFASDGHNPMEQNYMKYVKLKHFSCSACWQWILLHNIECFFPTSGLGSYKKQRMVLTDEEWQSIITKIETVPDSVYHAKEIEVGVISESQHNEMASIKFPSLQVRLNASLRTAEIAFCTWNDWQGLALNHFFLRIKDDYSVEVSNSSSKIIVPYDCGILF